MRAVSLLFHDVYASDAGESGFRSPAADRYKLTIPDFEAQLDGLEHLRIPDPGSRIPDPASRLRAVITVDDGGVSYYTVVAERLEAMGLRGYCFVTTDFIGQHGFLTPEQIRELHARGHVIGTHSASHPTRFSALSWTEMRHEWPLSRDKLEEILGYPVTTGSVPGGYFSAAVGHSAAECGLQTLFTSEPTIRTSTLDDCTLVGRFTIRRGHSPDMARRFVAPAPWARCGAWIGWNAKAVVKPVLGASYARVADWMLTTPARLRAGSPAEPNR
jgi:peptidoglycan/xylan/chitin deacetylase (PgdA/CDA1 family)